MKTYTPTQGMSELVVVLVSSKQAGGGSVDSLALWAQTEKTKLAGM